VSPGPAGVIWFEIRVRDLDAAEAFYGPLLGWTFRPFEEYEAASYHIISTPSGTLGGALVRSEIPDDRATPNLGATLYAEVDDLEVAVRQASELGGEVVSQRRAIGTVDGWFAVVRDPDGNPVGLWTAQPSGDVR